MKYQDLSNVKVHLVESLDDAMAMKRWLGEKRDVLAVDTETGGLEWWRDDLRLVQFGDENTGWSMGWGDWAGLVKEILREYEGPLVAHNMKFDLHYLEHNGVTVNRGMLEDTMILAHLADPAGSHALKSLSSRLIHPKAVAGQQLLKEAMMEQKWGWADVPIDFGPYWQYGALDTILTARLHGLLSPRVASGGMGYLYDLERASTLVLADMERRGARIDLSYVRAARDRLEAYIDSVGVWAKTTYGVENIRSNAQVAKVLMDAGHYLDETPSGRPKLDEPALERVTHPLAEAVLHARRATKTISTYFETLLDRADGDVVHADIRPLGARTGRMSIGNPPLQALTRGPLVRDSFIARDGNDLVLVDWDQMELRVFAHYANEAAMLQAIREGVDLHTFIAAQVFNKPMDQVTGPERQITKGVNFGIPYGAGPKTIAETADRPLPEVNAFLASYHKNYPGVKRFFKELEVTARKRLVSEGEAYVQTWAGRRQPCDKDKLYKLVNYLIQGGCADLLKRVLVDMDRSGIGEYLILPVHDELIADVPHDQSAAVAAEMEAVMTETELFNAPLTASGEIYPRWGDKYRSDDE